MIIWNTTIGEPLPIPGNDDRLHRAGLLNNELLKHGANIVWWTSTFNHFSKKYYFNNRKSLKVKDHYRLELLHGCRYKKNISFSRITNHIQIGRQFYSESFNYQKPDIIITSFPSIELAYYSVKYGLKNRIPVIVDGRDMWPDIFLNVIPKIISPIAKIVLWQYFKMTKFVFKNATGITGITNGFVNWGLNYATRQRTAFDSEFYLGYPDDLSNPNDLTPFIEKWRMLGIDTKSFVISYVGAIAKNKIDLEPIFKAAKIFKDNMNIKFVIAGDGDEKAYFENQAKTYNIDNVIFPGWINKFEIKSLLEISSMGIVPLVNRADYLLSIPNKPIEYIANQLPIATSLEGELKKLINKFELGFHYDNQNSFVKNIEMLFSNDKKLKRMASNCNKIYNDKFNSDKVYSEFSNHIFHINSKFLSRKILN